MSILVVDDDEFSQAVLRKRLLQFGVADIQAAHDGRAGVLALDLLERPPDVIFCDIFMPDMDGIEFVEELVARQYRGGLILVTAVNRDMLTVAQDIATLNGLKVLGAFTKPLERETLGRALGLVASS
ncbi:response regulator [Roseateles sp. GG27B]